MHFGFFCQVDRTIRRHEPGETSSQESKRLCFNQTEPRIADRKIKKDKTQGEEKDI